MNPSRGDRIPTEEDTVERLHASSLGEISEARAQSLVAPRPGKEAESKRAKVQARPAHHDRHESTSMDVFDTWDRGLDIAGGRELLVGWHDVEKMMRYTAASIRRDLRGPHVEASIDLQGVASDDLPRERLRNPEAELALSRAGGTDDSDERRRDAHAQMAIHRARSTMSATTPRTMAPRSSFFEKEKFTDGHLPSDDVLHLPEELDELRFVARAERPLDGEKLRIEELVERGDEVVAAALLRHAVEVLLHL